MLDQLQVIECEQGTDEWFAARAGVVTASEFATVLAKGRIFCVVSSLRSH
jgi:hypothetical protein